MRRRSFLRSAAGLAAGALPAAQTSATRGSIEVCNGVANGRVSEAVFFPFDDYSMPYAEGLRIHLVPGKTPGKPNPIVLPRGQDGEPDDAAVRFYGTVVPAGDELKMWYLARGTRDPGTSGLRVCYATSKDGVHWNKPALGLISYHGSKANNIVALRGGKADLGAIPLLYDPDEADSARRYKMSFEAEQYGNKVAVAFSPDGLEWTESKRNPVAGNLEQTGVIRFNGCYYLNGQGGAHFGPDRKIVTHASYDFENWTQSTCLSFRRGNVPPRGMAAEWNSGEESHLGAGMWNRGNVILGIYDMWHGSPSSDRTFVSMDLGLVVSNDALHFREPVPDFRLVPAYEELINYPGLDSLPRSGVQITQNEYTLTRPLVRAPAISHGQGMCNLDEKTLLWYESWGLGDVRLATWTRDRLGCFRTFGTEAPLGDAAPVRRNRHCITCPIHAHGADVRVAANVAGLSEYSELTVELLDEQFRPIAGFSGADAKPLRRSGLRQTVAWRERESLRTLQGAFRIRVNFGGLRPEDIQLYAVYIG